MAFCKTHKLDTARVTTRSVDKFLEIDGVLIDFTPASLYAYTVGVNLVGGP